MRIMHTLAISAIAGLAGLDARADFFIDPDLPGTTQTDGWTTQSLTGSANPGYPGFINSSSPWPAAIESSSGGDATLNKTANGVDGGPYPASGSIYFGSMSGGVNVYGGALTVTDATPVANLSTVVFQVEIAGASGFDFYNGELPSLTYQTAASGSDELSLTPVQAGVIHQEYLQTIDTPAGPQDIFTNTYLLQWQLPELDDATSFQITLDSVAHAQVYAMQLDQSDTFAMADVTFVPEPASLALLGLGGVAMAMRRHRHA